MKMFYPARGFGFRDSRHSGAVAVSEPREALQLRNGQLVHAGFGSGDVTCGFSFHQLE